MTTSSLQVHSLEELEALTSVPTSYTTAAQLAADAILDMNFSSEEQASVEWPWPVRINSITYANVGYRDRAKHLMDFAPGGKPASFRGPICPIQRWKIFDSDEWRIDEEQEALGYSFRGWSTRGAVHAGRIDEGEYLYGLSAAPTDKARGLLLDAAGIVVVREMTAAREHDGLLWRLGYELGLLTGEYRKALDAMEAKSEELGKARKKVARNA